MADDTQNQFHEDGHFLVTSLVTSLKPLTHAPATSPFDPS